MVPSAGAMTVCFSSENGLLGTLKNHETKPIIRSDREALIQKPIRTPDIQIRKLLSIRTITIPDNVLNPSLCIDIPTKN
jgi:hypothetical protein